MFNPGNDIDRVGRDAIGLNATEPIVAQVRTHGIQGFKPWHDFVHDNFPWLEMRNNVGSEFHANVGSCNFGDTMLATISSDPSEVYRTRHLAEAAEEGFIKLLWQMAGQLELEQDGRQCVINKGQATVCDTARPYTIRLSENSRFTVLMLPYSACPGWEKISQRLCGAALRDASTSHAALGALMALSGTAGQSNATALRAIHWMLSASLHQAAVLKKTVGVGVRARLSKAQGHILQNIGDPQLDPDHLASALCMSRRALYMLFKEYRLTPGQMIRNIRLEECHRILRDPAQRRRKILEVAIDHGFRDHATFSRQFKAKYGLTPSEYKHGENRASAAPTV